MNSRPFAHALRYLFVAVELCMLWAANAEATELIDTPERALVLVADRRYGSEVAKLIEAVLRSRSRRVPIRLVSPDDARQNPGPSSVILHLDTSDPRHWRLRLEYSGRRWRRDLSGIATDAAAIEAAALIAARAALALFDVDRGPAPAEALPGWRDDSAENRERLDVASKPAAGPAASRGKIASLTEQPTSDRAGLEPTSEGPTSARSPEAFARVGYRGIVYASQSTFSSAAYLGIGLRYPAALTTSVRYAFFPPVEVSSRFGRFDISRHALEVLFGWEFRFGAWRLIPEAGLLTERTTRSNTRPETGVAASSEQGLTGWAGVTALDLELSVFQHLGIVGSAGAEYYFDNVEFVAAGTTMPELLSPRPVRPRLELAAQWRFP